MLSQVAYRVLRKPTQTCLHSALLEQSNRNEPQNCQFSISSQKYRHPDDWQPQKGHIKKSYLRKYPLVRTQKDGTVTVEGVSNKAIPCPVPWYDPRPAVKIGSERFRPGEHNSGDLSDVVSMVDADKIDPSQPKVDYEISEELLKASPEVKRVLSLEFGRKKDLVNKVRNEIVRKVQEHPLDFSSLPVTIAQMTVEIRNHQLDLIALNERPSGRKRNKARRHDLDVLISHRRKCLDKLRGRDYKKFEWLLKTLDIVYKPRPSDESWEEIARRKHQDRLTDLWCDELRTFRLEKFRKELELKQPDFLRRKASLLKDILEEEKRIGEPPSVDESEIDDLIQKAESIELRIKEGQSSEREYHIYEEKIVTDSEHYVT